MIKCLECGFETNRLQWTHFRYKCTGKFTNSKEYRKAYPDAVLVSPELAATTSVTKDGLIKKYGKELGILKWDEYRKKQAYSNSFAYKREKHGWSKEQFDEYNSSRAQTLEKMIARHGEIEGVKKWLWYCDRQAFTNSRDYFIEKYGEEEGIKKFIQVNKGKSSSTNPKVMAEKMNITVDEAVQIILQRSHCGSIWGSNIEKEFTQRIVDKIGPLEYSTFTKPYGLWSHELSTYVIYDIKHKNKIVEFNGDYWHANPLVYLSDSIMRGGKLASEIHERDRRKIKTATDHGLQVLVVWELDFRKNKEAVINEVVKWMLNGPQ